MRKSEAYLKIQKAYLHHGERMAILEYKRQFPTKTEEQARQFIQQQEFSDDYALA